MLVQAVGLLALDRNGGLVDQNRPGFLSDRGRMTQ